MSEHDKELINRARHTIWEEMSVLREQCESDEAWNIIHEMELSQYHRIND